MAHFVNAKGGRISKSIQRSPLGAALTVGVWGAAGLRIGPNDPSAASMVPLGADSSGVSWFRLTGKRTSNVMIEARNAADRAVWDFFQLAVSGSAQGGSQPGGTPAAKGQPAHVQFITRDRRPISKSIQTMGLGVALVIGVKAASGMSVGPNDPSMAWIAESDVDASGIRWFQLTGRRVGHVMVEARVAGEPSARDHFQLVIVPAAQPNPNEEILAMGPEYERDPSYVDHVTAGHYDLASGSFRVDHRDGSGIELDFAKIQRDLRPGPGASIYVYYRNRANGKIYPRIFDRHTAPNITAMVEETTAAIPDAQLLQLAVEGLMRLVPVSGPGPGPTKRGVWKTVPPTAAERASTLVAKLTRAGKAIRVNIGGAGEVADAINLNPNIVAGRTDIPNLIRTWGERIAELFRRGSVDEIVSNRLPHSLNWEPIIQGAHQVLKPGGRITIRVYSAGPDSARIHAALLSAGFRNVKNLGNAVFEGVK